MIKVIVNNIGMILAVLSIINVSISFVFIYKNHKIIQEMEKKIEESEKEFWKK